MSNSNPINKDASSMPIAIIGMGVRFSGEGSDPERFWKMLVEGRSARSEIPKSRYSVDGFYHPHSDRLGSTQQRHAHFLEQDFKVFDAPFFSITPKEATVMDPTHRMLLEVAYEGFENAGLSLEDVSGTKTSCYIGTFTIRSNKLNISIDATGLSSSLASNRLSWFYDLKGPSITLDTACSSSLTAFHLACQGLRTGEAEMSIVGGSNLMFGPDMSILLGAAKILSPDGKSQMWDSKANGFARGEGIGMTVLKALDAALRDGDTVRAVVLASVASNDGKTPGISLPSTVAQEELIRTAYKQAGVDPVLTGYTFQTGTQAGDPIEAKAIVNTIGNARSSDLFVGSVKTNIGHLEGAAGIAGVIKAALVVERGLVPSNLWFEKLNPAISLPGNVKVAQHLSEWPLDGPRRASINSFGFGGSNAHVILEDAASYFARKSLTGRHAAVPQPRTTFTNATNGVDSRANGLNGINGRADDISEVSIHTNSIGVKAVTKPQLLVLSSSDQDGIKRRINQLRTFLAQEQKGHDEGHSFLQSLAYTLAERRTALPWKSFIVTPDLTGLGKSIDDAPAAVRSSDVQAPRVAFVFTGQGAQWFGMGKGLVLYDAFRESLLACEKELLSLGCEWSLTQELNRNETDCKLHLAEFSQPACTALQIALVDLLQQWGVSPSAVVGHSSGEIAAAYCAGIISRGQFASTISKKNLKGAMMAVSADADAILPQIAKLTSGKAVVAAVNSPKACTISGDQAAIDELGNALKADQISFKKLDVEVAYHSPHMSLIREAYETALEGLGKRAYSTVDAIPMFSSVTGHLLRARDLNPSYWVDNLVSTVKFAGAIRSLLHHSTELKRSYEKTAFATIFLEVGPHSALRSYLLDIFKSEEKLGSQLSYVTVLRRSHDSTQTALKAMGELYAKGYRLSLSKVNETPPNVKMLVTLPPYAWNHSTSYWEESHLSRQYRLRGKPRYDLLGYQVPGSPNPQWRNYLRCSENPWIREHIVQGQIVYPGAGLLVMAIEAARQIADANEEIIGYELRDVSISAALRVPDNEKGVEVLIQLRPRRTGTKAAPSTTLNEFTVSSWSDHSDKWQMHCKGLISATYKSSLTSSMRREVTLENQRHQESFQEMKLKCQKPARGFLYDTVETIGMHYGQTFRNITDLYAGENASYGVVSIPDTKSIMPHQFEYPFVIHPVTLDSVLHLLFPSVSGQEQPLCEAVVPFSFDRIFISADIPTAPGTALHGFSTAKKTSYTTWMSSISMSTEDWQHPHIIMEGLSLASLGVSDTQGITRTRAQCFEQTWHEDTDLMPSSQIKELIYKRTIRSQDDDSVLDKLEYVCLVYIQRCLDWFDSPAGQEHIPQSGFFKLYYEWLQATVTAFPPVPSDAAQVEAELSASKKRIATSNSGDITVQMVDRIGQNLEKIFKKEIEPLQVMLEGDLLYTFYRGAFGTSFNSNVAEYVGLVADKNPGLSILEIGAGTGGTTFHILERLRNADGTSKAGRYFFTDISPGFLAKAAERFSRDASIMEFRTLNVEDNPLEQGFEPESFDLIVCANVLHATKSIQETLTHCLCLIKPSGKLVLSEVTIKRIFCGFIMGPLPGWWLGEDDGRKGGPLLDVEEWNTALKQAGFSGVDIDVRGDCETSVEPISLMVSSKARTVAKPALDFVLITHHSDLITKLCSEVQHMLSSRNIKSTIVPWDQLSELDVKKRYCISFVELVTPLLAQIGDNDWTKVCTLILTASGSLWITGGAAIDCPKPHGSLMVGLSRAIRNENANALLATLDIESVCFVDFDASAAAILEVALHHSSGTSIDHEYAARGRTVYVPRVEKAPKIDAQLRKYESRGELENVFFTGCNRPLKLTIKTPGLLDTMHFEEDETYYKPIPEDWIEIKVKAVGLNFKDVLVAMGNLNEQKLGADVSGVVTRLGTAVTGVRVGDRVMTFSCDCFATFVRFPASGVMRMPDNMSFEDAASMPLINLTAYYSLITIGRLLPGETILIHAAAGGVGQAAIVVAQLVGAEVYATVGSEEKKELLIKEYGIPEDHIFSSRDLSFAKGIMRVTGGDGVDMILNSLAGEALRLSWHSLKQFGRFLEIGKADLFANTGLDMAPFLQNKTYAGVNLTEFENNASPRAVALFQAVGQLIISGKIKPVKPVQLFTFSEAEQAFRHMQTGKHMGKIVVRVDETDVVPAVPRTPRAQVDSNATYILAGGLGGICREIGRWLAENGAGNLVFLSRSAGTGEGNIGFIESLKINYGVNALAFNCDIGNREPLQAVLDICYRDLPPIKGCVTGAMVLRDTLFDKMTVEHLRVTVGPKVHGTWNLHDMLPKDLDFFVMLSSLAGVMGHRGQGNYGAGNIFQDNFSIFRRSQGLRAMTIDISFLLSVGFVAEHDEHVDHVKSLGLKVMLNSDLHGLMAIAMEGTEAHPAQVICGLPVGEYQESWYWIQDGKFLPLLNTARGRNANTGASISLQDELSQVTDTSAAIELICDAIVDKLSKLMMVPSSDIDSAKPMNTYGVDSLVAVELRNWMAKELLVEVSVFEIMANVPMRQLAIELVGKSKLLADVK
ncbi:beta-ketoacyl synthase domain-containing protein [Bisporella sp. PMI_857]|nr:beta-ketoacyl synthase domain-containing protein [Bisporella sp. PMI_857]